MAVRDALLALLVPGPRHGYQLKAEFEAATGNGWPLNIGQVYSTLQRLERDGLVEPADATAPGRDDRHPWRLTLEGRDAVDAWLASPPPSPAATRDDVSMKLLVTLATDPTSVLDILRDQRVAAMSELQRLTSTKASMIDPGLPEQLALDRTILLAESQIRWLELVEQRFEVVGTPYGEPTPNARLQTSDEEPRP